MFSIKWLISAPGAESVVMITSWLSVYREGFTASQELVFLVRPLNLREMSFCSWLECETKLLQLNIYGYWLVSIVSAGIEMEICLCQKLQNESMKESLMLVNFPSFSNSECLSVSTCPSCDGRIFPGCSSYVATTGQRCSHYTPEILFSVDYFII